MNFKTFFYLINVTMKGQSLKHPVTNIIILEIVTCKKTESVCLTSEQQVSRMIKPNNFWDLIQRSWRASTKFSHRFWNGPSVCGFKYPILRWKWPFSCGLKSSLSQKEKNERNACLIGYAGPAAFLGKGKHCTIVRLDNSFYAKF